MFKKNQNLMASVVWVDVKALLLGCDDDCEVAVAFGCGSWGSRPVSVVQHLADIC